MDYLDYIKNGFDLCDKIDMELRKISKMSNLYNTFEYADGILNVKAENTSEFLAVEFTIKFNEVVEKIIKYNLEPDEAIGILLKEKTCAFAQFKNN